MAFGNASLPTRKYAYGAREFLPRAQPSDPHAIRVPRQRFDGHDAALNQLRLAHRLQNKLVEIERNRRSAVDKAVLDACPELATLQAKAEEESAKVATLREQLSAANIANGRTASDPELVKQIKQQVRVAGIAWKAYSTRRKAGFADSLVKPVLIQIDKDHTRLGAEARNEAVAGGLYWATSLQVMTRVKRNGPPPRFKRFTGEGVISVQFQRKPDRASPKLPVLDTNGKPRTSPRAEKVRVKINREVAVGDQITGPNDEPLIVVGVLDNGFVECRPPMMAHESGGSMATTAMFTPNTLCWLELQQTRPNGIQYVTVHFRVASSPKGPVWVRIPTVLHRPLPEGGEVKWAHLSCRKIGSHYKWEVLFDIARPEWDDHPAGEARATEGTVAVALGWRLIDGEVRVAEWVGSDGASGTVRIESRYVGQWHGLASLRSIRDLNFDAMRAELLAWLATQVKLPKEWPTPPCTLHEKWAERVANLATWRSADRFASFIVWWRTHRLPGDDEIFNRLEGVLRQGEGKPAHIGLSKSLSQLTPRQRKRMEAKKCYYVGLGDPHERSSACRKQDRHLNDWAANVRARLLANRKDFYRNLAIDLSLQYKNVVIGEIDWHEIAENPNPEEAADHVNKVNRGLAACASLRDCLTHYMDEIRVDAADTVVTCHKCQGTMDNPKSGRWVKCERCRAGKMDRAVNAAKNLLSRGLMAVDDSLTARVM